MLDYVSKAFFHLIARRFIAGETVAEAIVAAGALEAQGFSHTLDHLGESVSSLSAADAATRDYLDVVSAVIQGGICRNISVKLTQLGLDVDKASAIDNLRRVLDRAEPAGFFVRIDMESAAHTEVTLDVFEILWQQGYRHMGVVLQAALYRSEGDLKRINAIGARVRLVKGAYNEPRSVAHQRKRDVDAAYARLMQVLLIEGHYPAIATHDPAMIAAARRTAAELSIPPERFEFQMLYGIRRDLQRSLLSAGYRVRIYIPFGLDWFPYFMRRLGERPANIAFVLRGLAGERG